MNDYGLKFVTSATVSLLKKIVIICNYYTPWLRRGYDCRSLSYHKPVAFPERTRKFALGPCRCPLLRPVRDQLPRESQTTILSVNAHMSQLSKCEAYSELKFADTTT